MLKLTGCILILLASAGTGFLYAADFQRYLEKLIDIQQIVYMMKGEMEYTKATLGEVFGRVCVRAKEPYRSWLCRLEQEVEERREASFPEIWDHCLKQGLEGLRLKKEHEHLLEELGSCLGQADADTGLGTLTLYLNRMDLEIRKTREALAGKKRLSSCMGIMGGLFLVILLI